MSDSLLEEYKAYYKVRAERFANNPNYKHSYEAETNLSDAMQSCGVLEEFKDKLGDKNIKCGIALIQDKYAMRIQHYTDMKETVRLQVSIDVLSAVGEAETAMDIVTAVNKTETEGMTKIAMDEANRQLYGEWFILDRIEIYENAEVPDNYKSTLQSWANEAKQSLIEGNTFLEDNNDKWQPGWRHTPEVILEHRHKRLSPYKDEHLTEQLNTYRNIINR